MHNTMPASSGTIFCCFLPYMKYPRPMDPKKVEHIKVVPISIRSFLSIGYRRDVDDPAPYAEHPFHERYGGYCRFNGPHKSHSAHVAPSSAALPDLGWPHA